MSKSYKIIISLIAFFTFFTLIYLFFLYSNSTSLTKAIEKYSSSLDNIQEIRIIHMPFTIEEMEKMKNTESLSSEVLLTDILELNSFLSILEEQKVKRISRKLVGKFEYNIKLYFYDHKPPFELAMTKEGILFHNNGKYLFVDEHSIYDKVRKYFE